MAKFEMCVEFHIIQIMNIDNNINIHIFFDQLL